MRTRTRLAGLAAATLAAVPLLAAPAGAAPTAPATPRASAEVDAATAWLASQQEADGGFELADFPGFETPDAVLALAAAGQPGPGWDEAAALAAVEAVTTDGNDALDAVDDWVDSVQGGDAATASAQAGKVIALVAAPLGLDPTDFDPSDDTAEPVDLVAALEAGAGGAGDFAGLPFGGRVFAAWAYGARGQLAPPALLSSIVASQQANGSFDFSGDPGGTGTDPDLTASVVIALTLADDASGPDTAPAVARAVLSLGLTQEWTGEWATAFDDGNPNSTSMVVLAAATLGGDPDAPCWRDAVDPRIAGLPYPSPTATLEARQQPDGHIAGPNDGFGLNTFATTQAVQALVAADGSWPYAGAGCTAPTVGANRRLVNAIYADLLGRLTDASGSAFWAGQLDSGALTPAQYARRLTGTGEYNRRVVDRLVAQYGLDGLEQPVLDGDERAILAAAVRDGRRYDAAAYLLGTQEYYDSTAPAFPAGPPTAESWVDAVYPVVVGRPADAAGRQWALGQLASGRSRQQVARTLLGSTEALRVLVTDTYHQLLRRDTDVAGRDFWVGEIRRGQSPERLVLLIAGSSEYVRKTGPAA
ncbi:DUF4214 domain-containing protein [Iamia majanohamensis]|uniref:DUF4214 domain-containing protein n=1 Tax=Iamia majanohamensis TaxID=467976 RepID=A0AAE9Y6N5_9ACTN|nr:DUF4214 domain-containing protein [Iamia majanohamensis]WCO65234.1 DUF4214 domain-containing protein [Iamia majanohamensis]